jgi:hypothetical protein
MSSRRNLALRVARTTTKTTTKMAITLPASPSGQVDETRGPKRSHGTIAMERQRDRTVSAPEFRHASIGSIGTIQFPVEAVPKQKKAETRLTSTGRPSHARKQPPGLCQETTQRLYSVSEASRALNNLIPTELGEHIASSSLGKGFSQTYCAVHTLCRHHRSPRPEEHFELESIRRILNEMELLSIPYRRPIVEKSAARPEAILGADGAK